MKDAPSNNWDRLTGVDQADRSDRQSAEQNDTKLESKLAEPAFRTILIVEDNKMNRDMLVRRLTKAGFEVTEAVDGRQGIALVKAKKPDVILMDLCLPGVDGIEATRRLKADPDTARIPIIALTAHVMRGDREAALKAGCDDYDSKPVRMNRLVGKIELLLEKRSDHGKCKSPPAGSR